MATAQYTTYIVAPDSNAQTPGPPGPTGPQGPAGPAGQNNNTVYYNLGLQTNGTVGSPIVNTGAGTGLVLSAARSFPLTGSAYQINFNWQLNTATFTGSPNGNLYLAVVAGNTLSGGGGTLIYVPTPTVTGNITTLNNSNFAGNVTGVWVPQPGVPNLAIGFTNYTGAIVQTGLTFTLTSINICALSSNAIIQTSFV